MIVLKVEDEKILLSNILNNCNDFDKCFKISISEGLEKTVKEILCILNVIKKT